MPTPFPYCECGDADSHYGRVCPAKVFVAEQRVRHENGDVGTVVEVERSGHPIVLWDGQKRAWPQDRGLVTAIRNEN